MQKRQRKGLFTLSVCALLIGLCYVVLVQPPFPVTVSLLAVAVVLCFLTGKKGV